MQKFRAFDKTTGKMYYPPNEHIYLNIDGTCVNFQNGEELEAMMALGNTDIDGKDVYSEDIVKYVIDSNSCAFIIKVGDNIADEEIKVLGNTKQQKIEDFK